MSLKSSKKVNEFTTEFEFFIDTNAISDAMVLEYNDQKEKDNDAEPDEDTVYQNALNKLLEPELKEAIEQANLNLVDAPKVETISDNSEEGISLKAVCITMPEISISNYKGIQVPLQVPVVTQEDIDEQVYALRKMKSHKVNVTDRAAQLQDEVIIDFEGFFGDEPFQGGKADDHPLRLGSGTFIPGFEDQVVGHNIGDEFDVVVPFPENYPMKAFAGKEATFKCKLKGIAYYEVPELTDEIVKEFTECENIDDFIENVRAQLEYEAGVKKDELKEAAVMNALTEKVVDPIPECLFDKRLDSIMNSFVESVTQQGMTMENYYKYLGTNEEALKESFRARAINEVKLRLALIKIAELENLVITEDELNANFEEMAAQYGLDVETLKNYIPVEEFKEDFIAQKAASLVLESATVVSADL